MKKVICLLMTLLVSSATVFTGTNVSAFAASTKTTDKPIIELPNKPNPQTNSTATVNWYDTKQEIDGFGVSEAFGKAQAIMSLPEQQRNQVIDLLWSKDKGIGLSFLRNQLYGSISPEKGKYDWNQGQDQVNLMKEIMKRGYDVKFTATAWSPPGWMKTTNSVVKGSLKPECYQDYADFLSKYVQEYKKQFGIDLYSVSMANEPNLKPEPDYDGCTWTAPQIHDFIKNNVKPTFARDNIATKFMAAEDTNFSEQLMADTLKDDDTCNRVDIVAAHGYGDGTSPFKLAAQKNKKIWMSEIMSYNNYDTSILDGLVWAKRIHKHMANADVNAWFYWWGAYTTSTSNSGLIYLDTATNNYELKKRLWTIGNYSKFVRPGYKRISATKQPNKDVFVTAFKDDATGKLVLVVTNCNVNAQTINFNLNGLDTTSVKPYRTSATEDLAALPDVSVSNRTFKAELPAQSVTTYVATGTPGAHVAPPIDKDDVISIGSSDAIKGTPTIDGETDSIWNNAKTISTDILADGSVNTEGAKAKIKTMWDENYIYVLADVTDSKLDKSNPTPYMQDSFETFIDENLGKTSYYEKDDAQYRVNFDNEASFSANCDKTKFKSATKKTATGYIVEEAIPLKTIKGSAGTKIGLEFQVNDVFDKSNRVMSKWSNTSGEAYKDTSTFGEVTLK
ncbi:sugar-binding protein [Clostridium sp. C2-6-12]|uniref:sugar-binding protein n=1 Tax=Clostridium sp. C2-6-12 TaxID=2698832 RepID=UPI00136D4BCB|nr:sugar-binding protein [Clostridium sp. C2-6-12]